MNVLILAVDDEPDVLFRQQFRRDLRAARLLDLKFLCEYAAGS
jgi:hypothetical protein